MEHTADLDLVPIPETGEDSAFTASAWTAEDGGRRDRDAARPVGGDAFFPDLDHDILTAQGSMPQGATAAVVSVAPGEVVVLPFGPDADFQAAIGHGNLAIKVGDVTVILEGYVPAAGQHPPVIESSDGHPLDIAAILAATDPGLDIATAAGPVHEPDNSGAILQPFGTAAGLGGFESVGEQDGSTGPVGLSNDDGGGGSDLRTDTTSLTRSPGGSAPPEDQGPNTPPVVEDVTFATSEDAKLQGVLSATDSNGDPVTFHLVGPAPDGVTLSADGSFSFDPRLQYDFLDGATADKQPQHTALSFQYVANDGQHDSNIGTVTVAIGGENDPAIISGDTSADYFLHLGTPGITGLLNVWDFDSGEARIVPDGGHTAWGSWSVDAHGNWEYIPDNPTLAARLPGPDDTLIDRFVVTSLDGTSQAVTITIHGHDEPPHVEGQTGIRGLTEDDAITVHLADFTTITDPDSTSFSYHAVSLPAGVSLAPDGTLQIDLAGRYDSLREGESQVVDVNYTVSDGYFSSNTGTFEIDITGVNDPASFSGETSGACLVSNGSRAAGRLIVHDYDAGEAHTKAAAGTGTFGNWFVDANGTWVYDVDTDNAAVKALAHGETLTDQFTVASADLSGTQTVTVTLYGNDVAPHISSTLTGVKLAEDETRTVHLPDFTTIVDPDSTVFSYELYNSAAGISLAPDGTLQIDAAGHYDALKAGESAVFELLYHVWDGAPGDPLSTISNSLAIPVEIVGVDDPATITGTTSASFEMGAGSVKVSGRAVVHDADRDEAHAMAQTGDASYGRWSVDSDGFWNYTPDTENAALKALGNGETLTDHFTVASVDGSASQTITITIAGHDVVPKIASTLGDLAMTEESTKTVFLPDYVTVTDPDSTVFTYELKDPPAGITLSPDGTLSINAVDYFDSAPAGQTQSVDIVFGVSDGQHISNLQTITLQISGINDPATISGFTDASLVVGGATAIGSTMSVHDADFGEGRALPDSGSATYGRWSVSENGTWVYRPDPSNDALKSLGADETLTDRFVVTSLDHTASQTITITIHGRGYVEPAAGRAAADDRIFGSSSDDALVFHDGAVAALPQPGQESGADGARSVAIDAEAVRHLADQTIAPDAVFGEHGAVRIDTDAVDRLYLSISKTGGSWTDTGIVHGGHAVYAHETVAGHADSTDAYVMVDTGARTDVHLNQDIA